MSARGGVTGGKEVSRNFGPRRGPSGAGGGNRAPGGQSPVPPAAAASSGGETEGNIELRLVGQLCAVYNGPALVLDADHIVPAFFSKCVKLLQDS